MSKNIFLQDILINDDTFVVPFKMDWLEGNSVKHQIQDLTHNYKIKSDLADFFVSTTDNQDNPNALALPPFNGMR